MMATRYPIVLFDWGDTLMVDVPGASTPMCEWPDVRAVDGAVALLQYLKASGRRIMLVTNARASDELQIRAALGRVGLEELVERIYCFKNTGLPKGAALYHFILRSLSTNPEQVMMIGDSLENDVQAASECGLHALWFNPRAQHEPADATFSSVHTHQELNAHFQNLDRESPSEAVPRD